MTAGKIKTKHDKARRARNWFMTGKPNFMTIDVAIHDIMIDGGPMAEHKYIRERAYARRVMKKHKSGRSFREAVKAC